MDDVLRKLNGLNTALLHHAQQRQVVGLGLELLPLLLGFLAGLGLPSRELLCFLLLAVPQTASPSARALILGRPGGAYALYSTGSMFMSRNRSSSAMPPFSTSSMRSSISFRDFRSLASWREVVVEKGREACVICMREPWMPTQRCVVDCSQRGTCRAATSSPSHLCPLHWPHKGAQTSRRRHCCCRRRRW